MKKLVVILIAFSSVAWSQTLPKKGAMDSLFVNWLRSAVPGAFLTLSDSVRIQNFLLGDSTGYPTSSVAWGGSRLIWRGDSGLYYEDGNSRVRLDTSYPNMGDITSVTAGNGLQGGGTAGAVTLDASPKTGGGLTVTFDSLEADSTQWPATDADVAGREPLLTKGNLTANAPLSFSEMRQVIGGSTIVSLDTTTDGTGVATKYQLGLKADAAITHTINGTTNQIAVAGSPFLHTASGSVTLSTPQDIHTGASPTFTGLTLSGLTAGSALFAGTAGLIQQDNANFFWDDATNRLGLGTASTDFRLNVDGALGGTGIASYYNRATFKIRGEFRHGGNASGILSAGGVQIAAQGTNNSTAGSGDINFFTTATNSVDALTDAAYTHRMKIRYDGNIGFNQTSWGTSAAKVLAIGSGTAPTTSPADAVQLWSADRGATAGKASLHIRTEDGTSHVLGDLSGIATTTPNVALDVNGGLATRATTIDLNGSFNDYAIGAGTFFRINNTAGPGLVVLTGVTGGTDGKLLVISNFDASGDNVVLNHESGSSAAANRFTNIGAANLTLSTGQTTAYIYDATSQRWRQFTNSVPNTGVFTKVGTDIDLTAQGAAVGTTTLYSVPASGADQYRLNWNAKVTRAASSSSTLGALTIVYTDPDGVAQTITAAAQIAAGTIATTSTGNSTTTVLLGMSLLLNAKASTNITYAFAYASAGATSMQYNLHLTLEEAN